MVRSVEGIYREGKVELLEPAPTEEARVIVTFISGNGTVDLQERGMSEADADSLRARLKAFAEDWERPEMDAYDAL